VISVSNPWRFATAAAVAWAVAGSALASDYTLRLVGEPLYGAVPAGTETAPPAANPPPAAQSLFGLSLVAGMALPGTISVSPGGEADTKIGWVVRAAGDAMLIPKLSMGAYVLYGRTSTDPGSLGLWMLGLGGTLKGHFQIETVQLRAGLAIAFQVMNSDAIGSESAKGLGLAPVVEVAVPVANNMNLLIQTSFVSQPAGGNKHVDVTWAPIFYLAAGIEYAK
jgi:hypothetical protein